MATLLEVAGKLGSLIAKNAPVKTGKLQRALKTQNTGRNILGGRDSAQAETDIVAALKNASYSFEFNIDVSPPGAEYGKFWNDPTVSKTVKKGRTKNVPSGINFAQKAYQSPEFQAELDKYIESLGEKIAVSVGKTIEKELKQ